MTVTTTLTNEERIALVRALNSDPVDWIEQHFYIPDPRDPVTGERYGPGPIRLAAHQKKLLRGALTMVDNRFPYVTILYSTIKKSGKTALAAAVSMWYADVMGPYNEIYCVANDGKQAGAELGETARGVDDYARGSLPVGPYPGALYHRAGAEAPRKGPTHPRRGDQEA